MFVHTIYMTIDIYIYTHICACMCMYVYVLLCMVAFQPPSSLLPASLQHLFPSSLLPAPSQPPYSLLPASFQPTSSIFSDTQVHWSSICFCTYVHWQSILFDIYMCIHHPSSLITYMHWSSICMVGLSHTHVQCLFLFCLPRTHVGALSADTKDVYPVCIALHMHIMPCDRLVFVELHIHD